MSNQLNRIALIILLVSAMGSLQSCYMTSALRTARTLAPGEGEVAANLSLYSIQNTEDDEQYAIMYPEVALSTGIGDRMDFQGKVGMLSLYGEGRYQVVGDRFSPVAASIGLGVNVGGLPILSELVVAAGVHVPAYISYHPSNQFAIYASPRVSLNYYGVGVGVGQEEVGGSIIQSAGIVGIEVGDRFKIRAEGGIQSISPQFGEIAGEQMNIPMYQLSMGMSYRFGSPR